MGTNVYNDINSFDEKSAGNSGKKVIIIYTTAGNLHDDDDTKSCDCKDPYHNSAGKIPYWQVREYGAENSIHLAATRIGGWGAGIPYPSDQTVVINGHSITKYEFKNTVSYYLRIKSGQYGKWLTDKNISTETVDSSSVYVNWQDFMTTIYYIYKTEIDESVTTNQVDFNLPDINEEINPNDHSDHYLAGRAGCEAAKLLSTNVNNCYRESLFIDYHTENLPVNLKSPDIQNESSLTAVYCLALLDYNAWPEWGTKYCNWTDKNYFRTITTCEDPIGVPKKQ